MVSDDALYPATGSVYDVVNSVKLNVLLVLSTLVFPGVTTPLYIFIVAVANVGFPLPYLHEPELLDK